ncbi:MAG: alpha-galactosidase [Coprobacter sp.]|nr:alpha-galactosidase [Coprobacter sp.]
MKRFFSFLCISWAAFSTVMADDYLISTSRTSLLLSGNRGEKLLFQYYGGRIGSGQEVYNSETGMNLPVYPEFGIDCVDEPAIQVTHADGNMSLDLLLDRVEKSSGEDSDTWTFVLYDSVYPFGVNLCYRAYRASDVIETWAEISHQEKKPVTLFRFASGYIPVRYGEHWLSHLSGDWARESWLSEERLLPGMKVIKNKDGVRNAQMANPSFMLSIGGRPEENTGTVLGGTLAWSGNYALKFDIDYSRHTRILAGINEEASQYTLMPKERFVTPELAFTYSTEGKGGVSRNFHRWARSHKLAHGAQLRDILLNSWEGVYFDVNQPVMERMMQDFAALGGELFVMDDGWFGEKYPRSNSVGLGDWVVCKERLPDGIASLVRSAGANGLKFGIWIEPEMADDKSELFEKHPDWVIGQKTRTLKKGRGDAQVVLDLSNPKVQDFVFGVVDGLMTENPDIAYIKWDANMTLVNYGSNYLPADRQSHLYIDYHRGLLDVLRRIQQKYPDLQMQACASGGGRANYGLLPYFTEFWVSDNTDALQRIYMQWGISHFFPANAMASHVSAGRNHQTGRATPIKFRFDVAMSGRLGMEMQPKDMTEEEAAFARKAIAVYKEIRPVVQQGDLYRLFSPYDGKGFASLMYVAPDKGEGVFFAYKLEHFYGQPVPRFRLAGLDAGKRYRLEEINQTETRLPQHGKTVSGRYLMEEGIDIPMDAEYASMVIRLTAEE